MSQRQHHATPPPLTHRFDATGVVTFRDGKAATRSNAARATAGQLVGYACVWNELSSDRGGYSVRLLPGSARFASRVDALLNHNYEQIVATTANGTLRLASGARGVRVEIDLADTTHGRDAAELVRGGFVGGMSFAMSTAPRGTIKTESGINVMNVPSFELIEVTITPVPAFLSTEIAAATQKHDGYAALQRQRLILERLKFQLIKLPPLR